MLLFSEFSFSGCDICPVRLFLRAGMNVLLSPKAEAAAQTHHFGRKIFRACNATNKQGVAESVKIMGSRPARSNTLIWCGYGGGLISATTGHAASGGLEQRRHGRAR